jgi:hypothetical protein
MTARLLGAPLESPERGMHRCCCCQQLLGLMRMLLLLQCWVLRPVA